MKNRIRKRLLLDPAVCAQCHWSGVGPATGLLHCSVMSNRVGAINWWYVYDKKYVPPLCKYISKHKEKQFELRTMEVLNVQESEGL